MADPQQLLIVAIALAALTVIHALVLLVLWGWRWPDGSTPLPRILVFPRAEIILVTTTVMAVSEAFGALASTRNR